MLKAVAGASDRWRVLLSDSSTAGRAHRTCQVVAVCVGTRAVVAELRASLLAVAGDGTRDGSPLFAGLVAQANGWRAQVPPPGPLPWHPLVWYRGGYPDGS